MREQFSRYRFVILSALAALAVTAAVCFATPIEFSGFLKEDALAPFWYYLSESGGIYGTAALIVIISIGVAVTGSDIGRKLVFFFGTLIFLGVLLGSLAYFNEHLIKPAVKAVRPSHLYLANTGAVDLEALYNTQDDKERMALLRRSVEDAGDKLSHIHPAILKHWVFESGYSFPSGHSQNAFMLAILAAAILRERIRKGTSVVLMVPVLWAVMVCLSRVAIGIHTSYDVVAGAAAGLIIASIILVSGLMKKMFR